MKILPINTSPYIRTYPYHAFINTIINNEMTCNETLAKIRITNANNFEWKKKLSHSKIDFNGDYLVASSNPHEAENGCCFYRRCMEEDEIVIKVDYQQFVNVWAGIYLFLMPDTNNLEDFRNLINSNEIAEGSIYGKSCGFGYYNIKNRNIKRYSKTYDINFKPYCLKLKRNKEKIQFYISEDESSWELIEEEILETENSSGHNIGISINLCENQYYNWVFTNFIQLYGNLDWETCIDWISYPKKYWKCYTCNPFLSYHAENKSILKIRNWDLWDFICDSIKNKRYIEFILEEKYIVGTLANQQNNSFIHENLCYGYEEDSKTVLLMNFYQGKPKLITVPYDDLLFAFNEYQDTNYIFTMEYLPDTEIYHLNIRYICDSLHSYLEGINTSVEYSSLINPSDAIYGINLYDELISEKGIRKLINDRRQSYIIFEHKKVMKDRLEFLTVRNIVSKDEIAEIAKQVNKVYEMAEKILMLGLKNRMKRNNNIEKIIKDYLMDMKSIEQKCYFDLMNLLLSKL